jgi:hypothetical protein
VATMGYFAIRKPAKKSSISENNPTGRVELDVGLY